MWRLCVKPIAAVLTVGAFMLPRGCQREPYVDPAPQAQSEVAGAQTRGDGEVKMTNKTTRTDAEWRKILTAEQYEILRRKGTEKAFSGEYDHFFEAGAYLCAGCGTELFTSEDKYNSGCGWPAFTEPADKDGVEHTTDASHGMVRTEVTCSRCGGHLGHVFNDGPKPTGQRYCINSAALDFKKEEK